MGKRECHFEGCLSTPATSHTMAYGSLCNSSDACVLHDGHREPCTCTLPRFLIVVYWRGANLAVYRVIDRKRGRRILGETSTVRDGAQALQLAEIQCHALNKAIARSESVPDAWLIESTNPDKPWRVVNFEGFDPIEWEGPFRSTDRLSTPSPIAGVPFNGRRGFAGCALSIEERHGIPGGVTPK